MYTIERTPMIVGLSCENRHSRTFVRPTHMSSYEGKEIFILKVSH